MSTQLPLPSRISHMAVQTPHQREASRLRGLERMEVLDSPPDPSLDAIVQLCADVCEVSAAAITLVRRDTVWFKSSVGLHASSMPRADAPCDETIRGNDLFTVPNAADDEQYGETGIHIGSQTFQFYAGAPLVTSDGSAIGCLCIYDDRPRELDEVEANTLRTLAQAILTRMELNLRLRSNEREARTRQRVEAALTVERNFVSAVLDTVGALVVVFDTAGRVVRFNRICEIISGYPVDEIVGHTLWDTLVPASERAEAIEAFTRLRDGRFPAAYEDRWLTRDQSSRRIQWTATALTDGQKDVAFIIATGIDVTMQREAEETLRESESRYRQFIEGSLGAVFTHDQRGVLLSINSYGAENLGFSGPEMLGRPLTRFLHEDDKAGFQTYLRQLLETGEAQGTFDLCHRDGTTRILAFRNRLIESTSGEHYALCFGVDITEKKRAEERLLRLTQQSNSILDSVGDGILGMDLDGACTVCNPAAAHMLGYSDEQIHTTILGNNLHELVHHHRADGRPYPQRESPILKAAHERKTVRISSDVFWRADGTSFPVEYVACPITENGLVTGVVVAFSDTTERSALDRMKDEFVSTVSHELRTPLTSMRASLGLIASGALASRPDKQDQMLQIAIGNTDRLVTLVNDILELERIGSGKAELHYSSVSADGLVRHAAELLAATAAKAGIEFRFQLRPVSAWADAERLVQTVTNLISNALKFTPPGGTITLSTRSMGPNETQIQVTDTGRGIPPDKLDHIFGRFQQVDASDSRTMGGTGLGLAICRSIVTQHGGKIWAESEVGKGASFFINLPTKPSNSLR